MDITFEHWREHFALNCDGLFFLCQVRSLSQCLRGILQDLPAGRCRPWGMACCLTEKHALVAYWAG